MKPTSMQRQCDFFVIVRCQGFSLKHYKIELCFNEQFAIFRYRCAKFPAYAICCVFFVLAVNLCIL